MYRKNPYQIYNQINVKCSTSHAANFHAQCITCFREKRMNAISIQGENENNATLNPYPPPPSSFHWALSWENIGILFRKITLKVFALSLTMNNIAESHIAWFTLTEKYLLHT